MFGGGRRMKKLALLIVSIGLFMICFGIGWIIGESMLHRHSCDNTTNISWYLNNCVDRKNMR